MSERSAVQYRFGEFSLDPARRVLRRNNDPIPLTPKAFDTLLVLVREKGHVVGKEELLNAVWPNTFVEEATLAQNVFTLRKALGQKDAYQFIETVPKHGYRFAVDVTAIFEEPGEIVYETHTSTTIVSESFETETLELMTGDLTEEVNHLPKIKNISSVAPRVNNESRLFSNRGLRRVLAVLALCALVVFVGVMWRVRKSATTTADSVGQMRIRRLTNNGQVVCATLSHDNTYVAYAAQEGEHQALWLSQVESATNLQVVPPTDVRYQAVVFAPDGASIYYVRYERNDIFGNLYQMPVLGGTPRLIVSDIDSAISFSPDGKQFAFFRDDLEARQTMLITANADGSNSQKIGTYPGFFSSEGPAWSPDGREIVFPIFSDGDPNRHKSAVLMSMNIETGIEKPVIDRKWNSIGGVAWLDNQKLVVVASDETTEAFSAQLWEISRNDGETRRITNDLNSYSGLSVSRTTGALITAHSDRVANFWVAPAADFTQAKQITAGFGDDGGEFLGIAWTTDDRIVFGSTAGGGLDIWAMDQDGRNRKQLTLDPLPDFKPTVSPLDGSIVFVSTRTGVSHLWKISADGLNPRQLTQGNTKSYPTISPDGKWIVYTAIDKQVSLWKLPLDGSEPRQLTDRFSWLAAVSPDGKLIACFYKENLLGATQIALIPAEGGAPVKLLSPPPTLFGHAGLRWTPDGSSLIYINNEKEISNFWSQPIDGRQPHPLTHFDAGQIFRFALSPNGKKVVFERGTNNTDVILITNLARQVT